MNFFTFFNQTVTKTLCFADGVQGKTPQILKSVKRMTPRGHPVLPSLAKHETFRGLNPPHQEKNACNKHTVLFFPSAFMQIPRSRLARDMQYA